MHKTKRIVVTGGLGFIGSHTVVELQKKGFDVVIIDNLSNSHIEILDRIAEITKNKPLFFNIDLKSKKEVFNFFSTQKIDGVIHFAASKAIAESMQMPLEYYENNIISLLHVLQAMKVNHINNLIFSSSCSVYGQVNKFPITEKFPLKPALSPYGKTKQIGEEMINNAIKVSNLNAISLRYFNPIGAHETAKIGELPIGVPQNLVPYITQTAIGIRKQLFVFGKDYPTPDGTAIRDYVHVVDLAKAHLLALDRLFKNKNEFNFEFFNIGAGKGYSVLEIVKTFEKVNNLKLKYKIVERRKGDTPIAYADISLAYEKLGWKASKTLEEALKSAWKWQQQLK